MKPKIAALGALVVLACGLLAAACGSSDHEAHAQALYNAYRTAEDSRTDAEEELRLAFSDIASAAQAQDRDGVLEAAQRGQDAVDQINDLITAELEAAQGLEEIDSVSAQAKQLSNGLRLSRSSLALVGEELAIEELLARHVVPIQRRIYLERDEVRHRLEAGLSRLQIA